jgi:hypothetical protein
MCRKLVIWLMFLKVIFSAEKDLGEMAVGMK